MIEPLSMRARYVATAIVTSKLASVAGHDFGEPGRAVNDSIVGDLERDPDLALAVITMLASDVSLLAQVAAHYQHIEPEAEWAEHLGALERARAR